MRPFEFEESSASRPLLHQCPRVLIVEDSVLISLDLENILNEVGCKIVGTCADAGQSLRLISETQIDVALVDYVLVDGVCDAVIVALRAKRIPFAICSGRLKSEMTTAFPDVPFVSKPYVPEEVCDVISQLVGTPMVASRRSPDVQWTANAK